MKKLGSALLLSICLMTLLSCNSESYECPPLQSKIIANAIPVANCNVLPSVLEDKNDFDTKISIHNMSRYDICDLSYNAIDMEVNYGSILAGNYTKHLSHPNAFGYPAMMTYEDYEGDQGIFAIDFVGEPHLDPGFYNYNYWVIKTEERHYAGAEMVLSQNDLPYLNYLDYSCPENEPQGCGIDFDKVNLRIQNHSIFNLCGLRFTTDGKETDFGNISAGDTSCYVSHELIDKNNFRIEFNIQDIAHGQGLEAPVWRDIVEDGKLTLHLSVSTLGDYRIPTVITTDD